MLTRLGKEKGPRGGGEEERGNGVMSVKGNLVQKIVVTFLSWVITNDDGNDKMAIILNAERRNF